MNTAVIENEIDGDVISANGDLLAGAETPAVVDRGDAIDVQPDVNDLKELVKGAPKDGESGQDPDQHKDMPQHIPKARFDEVNTKKNELAVQLAEVQRKLDEALKAEPVSKPAVPEFDEGAKEEAYLNAILEGDTATAKNIRSEINAHFQAQAEEGAVARVEKTWNQRQAVNALQDEASKAYVDYPYLGTEEGAQAQDLIIAFRDSLIAKGTSPAEALREAVNTIAPKFSPTLLTDGKTENRSIESDPRQKGAVERGAKDSTAQPPSTQVGSGNRQTAGRVNAADMTDEQFAALPDAEKKRLRGD